jgi:2,3-bisphosphoglycerate-independent phosphoglycerate mutase
MSAPSTQKKTVVLAILDGWGIGRRDATNPIFSVNPKTINYLKQRYLSGALQSSGIAVGLPWNEVGNSEVGHLTIGSGKVVYQHYPRITLAIERGSFFKNEVFLKAFEHVKKNNSALNIAGLLTEGNVHASFDHLKALIEFAAAQGVGRVNLHLFADGKDSRPRSALALIENLRRVTDDAGVGVLASFIGRHLALDRDSHWDRTRAAYEAMVGVAEPSTQPLKVLIEQAYEKGLTDEYLPATLLGPEVRAVADGDALVFIDFREDSVRQIVESFIQPGFDKFPVKQFKNLFVATMTEYAKNFNVPVAFPSEEITHPLGRVLSDAGKTQLLIAETEKYAHVTYFFNGYRDEPFPGQTKFLVPSRNVERHDQEPQMMAAAIADKVVEAVQNHLFDFIVVNFANADMVAHTGNFAAGLVAIQTVDEQLGRVVKACEESGAYLVVTADHGNAEVMIDAMTGSPETSHDPSPVPVYVLGPSFERAKSQAEADATEAQAVGILSDVAPTILDILGIPQPPEMNGQSLLPLL